MNIQLEQLPDGWTRWPNKDNDNGYHMANKAVNVIAELREALEIIAKSSSDSYAAAVAKRALGVGK